MHEGERVEHDTETHTARGPELERPIAAAGATELSERVRVLIVEDHHVVAEGLELTLQTAADLEVVGVAHTAEQAVGLAERLQPHVILMDFHLPDGSGSAAIARIRARVPGVAVVVLSADSSQETLLLAVEAGASGYLLKTQAAAQVIQAVRRAADGEMLIPAATLAALLGRQRQQSGRDSERERVRALLTPRELEVLGLMATGLDNRSISARLSISFTTVRGHVQSILSKLAAHSKLEAVVKASDLGLIQRAPGTDSILQMY